MDSLQLSHFSNHCFASSSSQPPPQSDSQLPLILAVDDDEDNLLLMIYTLETLNCSVITAIDGQTALEKATAYQPNLILLDIMLSQIDGIELVSHLKQNPNTKKTPVIAVTALARVEDKERILKAGCDDYISKPYMLEDFESLVCRYLNISAQPV